MATPLRVAISAIGRFHMFDLSRQMLRLGQEVTLFTGNPMFKVDADLRPYARTYPLFRLLSKLRSRLPPEPRTTWWNDIDMGTLGRWLARSIDPAKTDILDALDGLGPAAGRLMKRAGKVWICNRGSAHILSQKALLEEESRRWNAPLPYFSRVTLDRCLQEYSECDAIAVPSDFAKRTFEEQGTDPRKLYVCPYGVDLSMFYAGPKRDANFRVLFVGSISIRKGIGYLLEALRPLVERRSCELWLIGPVDDGAKPLLAKNEHIFVYKGIQPRAKLSSFYSQGSVLVLPSIEEGLALVQAQAMACGLPVIATSNTGAENLFRDGIEGFIVPIRDAEGIRARVEWMIANPAHRDEMAAAALRRVTALNGWARYGEQCLQMYREVLAARSRPLYQRQRLNATCSPHTF